MRDEQNEGKGREGKGKPRLKPINRQQLVMRPMDVEQLVPEDHEVRAIWDFVGRLDLSSFYEKIEAVEGEAGRPPHDPQLLISLWLYAISKGVNAGREIGRLCETDPAYQWLTGLGPVNYHTLCDFRVEHEEALKELFIQVLGVLSAEGLITLERVMHDGVKIKACASADTFRREERVRQHLETARKHLEELGDPREAEEVIPRVAKARQRAARERQERLEKALEELEEVRAGKSSMEEKQKARVSLTDPEARIMKQGDGGYAPSYNGQISTDGEAGVIVGVGVTQAASDYEELMPAMDRIHSTLGADPKQVVTDGGFTSRNNIIAMDKRGVNFFGSMGEGVAQSAGQMDRRGVDPAFRPCAFTYDEVSDTYRCPAGKTLTYEGKETLPGRTNYRYRARAGECGACEFKSKCCPQNGTKGRCIVRGVDAPEVKAFLDKMKTEDAQAIYRRRGAVSEFPNAWIKAKLGLRQFRLRGLIKVGIELLWACLIYNVKQWIRLRWRPQWGMVRA